MTEINPLKQVKDCEFRNPVLTQLCKLTKQPCELEDTQTVGSCPKWSINIEKGGHE